MSATRRFSIHVCAAAALVACAWPLAASAAGTKSLAYFAQGDGRHTAYLIDWQPHARAQVVSGLGRQAGNVAADTTQQVISFDAPISATISGFGDSCGAYNVHRQVNQIVVRDLAGGISQLVEIGSDTNVGGCDNGVVTPFGSLTDEGTSLNRLNMSARPAVTDLVPSVQVAGFSEEALVPGDAFPTLAEDVVTFQTGNKVQFESTGNQRSAAFNANKWLVINLSGEQRAYTRLAVDASTAAETWLLAKWVGGQPVAVEDRMLVKPAAGAGFGTTKQASRIWEAGLFVASRTPFTVSLYKNGNGERLTKDLDLGVETRTPITWVFDGLNIVQTREFGGTATGQRRWVPLRNEGTKVRWVMESEQIQDPDNGDWTLIKPRVNYYKDTGKAVRLRSKRSGRQVR